MVSLLLKKKKYCACISKRNVTSLSAISEIRVYLVEDILADEYTSFIRKLSYEPRSVRQLRGRQYLIKQHSRDREIIEIKRCNVDDAVDPSTIVMLLPPYRDLGIPIRKMRKRK